MKKFFYLISLAVLSWSCSPQVYTMSVESRYPSLSGDDFFGKSMVVVTRDDNEYARRLAAALGTYYPDAEGNRTDVPVLLAGADCSSRDSLTSIVMSTGNDVVLYTDDSGIYYYDSMGRDSVKVIAPNQYSTLKAGWQPENYNLYYFDSGSDLWGEAIGYAIDFRWAEAISDWTKLAGRNDNNLVKRACAEYNLAVGCYMTGRFELALQWLDLSDEDEPLPSSKSLRKRINARIGK